VQFGILTPTKVVIIKVDSHRWAVNSSQTNFTRLIWTAPHMHVVMVIRRLTFHLAILSVLDERVMFFL
jgi:hypothetical protein